MTAQTAIATVTEAPRRSVLMTMAARYNMEPAAFEQTLRATVVPNNCTKEQFAAFLVVANEYGLNPLTKEIYAFPSRGGGIQPIVPIDGWTNIINSHSALDGIEFDDHHDEKGKLTAITCRLWRKDRSKPIVVTEYMSECVRQTDTWKQYPHRMLRHKALIQCARYAFGLAGIVDPDEAERIGALSPMRDVTPPKPPAPPAPPVPPVSAAPTQEVGRATRKHPEPAPTIEAPVQPAQDTSVPDPGGDPESFLKWIDETLTAVSDPDQLPGTWDERIEPHCADLFPPDQEEAMKIYRRHEARLQP